MKMVDLIYAILIIIIFLIMFGVSITMSNTKHIKDNWATYKCNPIYMPFSKQLVGVSAQKTMTECVQGFHSGYMDYLLVPIEFSLDVVQLLIGTIVDSIGDLQDFTSDLTTSNNSMFSSLFSSLGGMVGGTTSLFGEVSDMFEKSVGITTVIQYISEGMVLTAESLYSVMTGSSSCFHPNTKIKLQNGNVIAMKNINLGDVLENGSIVEATMNISNLDANGKIKEYFYKIYDTDLNLDIYVTGSHLVKDQLTGNYVKVEDSVQSIKTDNYTDTLSCLITNDHRIVIGSQEFWDWEDENVI